MNSSVSTFFSKDAVLHSQVRLNRTRKNGTRPTFPVQIPSTSTHVPLDIIPEEDLDSMPTPASTARAQRRHALSATSKVLRTTLEDIAEEPVVFTDVNFNPPLPPLPTSSSCSRLSYKSLSSTSSSPPSSPDSQSLGLPLTPSTSDDDLPLPSLAFNHKRSTIKPLVINKLQRPSTLPVIDYSEESDSEDSDSEWYTREFSKVLTLDSTLPPISFPAAHRDSISIVPAFDYCPTSPSPVSSERRRRRCSGLKYPAFDAPPVPPIPAEFLSPRCTKTLSITAPRRPPPRMSIPDDACSAFSLSLYTDDIASPLSIYSQDSARTTTSGFRQGLDEGGDDVEGIEFPAGFEVQMDCPMMLPLSLPGTPIDLEADIAHGLEELWMMKENVGVVEPQGGLGVGFILEEMEDEEEQHVESNAEIVTPIIICTSPPLSPLTIPGPPPPTAAPVTPITPVDPPCSPASTISAFSFPPSPCVPCHELSAAERDDFDERRYGLKSKWSSSTLASVREEHASLSSAPPLKFPGAASKLKMYFQGQHKRTNGSISTPPSPKTPVPPPTPISTPVPGLVSPLSVKGKGSGKDKKEKRRSKRESEDGSVLVIGYTNTSNVGDCSPTRRSHDSYTSPTNSPSRWPVTSSVAPAAASPRRSHDLPPTPTPSPSRSSPTLRNFGGVRRSPSQSSAGGASECASEESCASARSYWNDPITAPSSSGALTLGLRRKPIPVEMFLRGGV